MSTQRSCRSATSTAPAATTRLAVMAATVVLLSSCGGGHSSAPTAPRDREAWTQTMEASALEHFGGTDWSEVCSNGVVWACELTEVSAAQRGALVLRMGTAEQPRRELLAGQAVHEVLDALQPQHPSAQWVIATDHDHIILARQARTDTAEE